MISEKYPERHKNWIIFILHSIHFLFRNSLPNNSVDSRNSKVKSVIYVWWRDEQWRVSLCSFFCWDFLHPFLVFHPLISSGWYYEDALEAIVQQSAFVSRDMTYCWRLHKQPKIKLSIKFFFCLVCWHHRKNDWFNYRFFGDLLRSIRKIV